MGIIKAIQSKYRKFLLWSAAIFFIAFLFHIPFFVQSNKTLYFRLFDYEWNAGVTDNFLGVFSPRLLVSGRFLTDIFHPFGVLGIVAGIVLLFRSFPRKALLFYGNLRMTVTPRYFVLFIPALTVFCGYTLAKVYDKRRWGKAAALVLVAALVGFWMVRIVPNLKVRHDRAILPEFAVWVKEKTEEGACVIVADERYFMQYYGQLRTMNRPMSILKSTKQELEEFNAKVIGLLQQGIPVYMTSASLWAYDRDKHFSEFVLESFDLEVVGHHPYEDWHNGSLELHIFDCQLIKIKEK